MSLFDLKGQTAVIFGASSGIGARAAETLARAGASLFLGARRTDRLMALKGKIEAESGVACEVARCDVAEEGDIVELVEAARRRFGRIDISIQNAGLDIMKRTLAQTTDLYEQVVDVNLRGTFICCREVGRVMIERRYGRLINVASINAIRGGRYPLSPYSASKAGVCGLSRALAREWGRDGITVNALLPGLIETEMSMRISHGATPEQIEKARQKGEEYMRESCPVGRMGQPEDFDGVILLLASPCSAYITGQEIVVDGGLTI